MLLDAKSVMDNVLPDLEQIRELVPEVLQHRFEEAIARFYDTLCECDVANEYVEKDKPGRKPK